MNYFKKSKDNKIHKASKTIKKTNNSDIKSFTVRHPKTVANLLKPITQSKINPEELEVVEKTNIFDIELGTIEHPKTVTKISNSIK